jgi:hypothetical protein
VKRVRSSSTRIVKRAEEALAVGLADVDPPALAGEEGCHRPLGLVGDAEHAGEIVAATAGQDPERGVRARDRAADGADQAVAAHHHRHLTEVDGAQRLFDRVLDAASQLDSEGDAALVELVFDLRQQSPGAPAARRRVDQQGQRSVSFLHRATLCFAA